MQEEDEEEEGDENDLPHMLPKDTKWHDMLKGTKRYTLPKAKRTLALLNMVDAYKTFTTNPFFNTQRDGMFETSHLSVVSFMDIEKLLFGYWGFLLIQVGMDPKDMSLENWANCNHLFLFMAFLMELRGVEHTRLKQVLTTAIRVVTYLGNTKKLPMAKVEPLVTHYGAMLRQVSKSGTHIKGSMVEDVEDLPDPIITTKWQVKVIMERLKHFKMQVELGEFDINDAKDARDIVMMALIYNFTGSTRLSIIMSLTHANSKCINIGCMIKECKGNTLEKMDDGSYKLITPHHKNSWRGIQGHNFLINDPMVCEAIDMYMEHGWPLLAANHEVGEEEEGEEEVPYIFLNNSGCKFPSLTQLWEREGEVWEEGLCHQKATHWCACPSMLVDLGPSTI